MAAIIERQYSRYSVRFREGIRGSPRIRVEGKLEECLAAVQHYYRGASHCGGETECPLCRQAARATRKERS